jgi:hypothetical protein
MRNAKSTLTLDLPSGHYHTIAGLEVVLGVCRDSIRKLIKERRLEAREHCGLAIIPDSSLQSYCANLPLARLARKEAA